MAGYPSLPVFPYGAVYFRKSNPLWEDWARDYRTAVEDGVNSFRHWFLWSAIEVAPGEFDWEDYDRQLDLAAEHGIRTTIAEMITSAPEWAFRQYPHALLQTGDGRKRHSDMSASCVVGGFPGLCLDNDDVRERAELFLRALVAHYKDHPSLGAYDIWNECSMQPETCYCQASVERFRLWLQSRYGDLSTLCKAWFRPSYSSWEDVQPPGSNGPYPDVLDWLEFRIENAYGLMKWRVDVFRELDPLHPVIAHAHGIALTLSHMSDYCRDDWRAAAEADIYGYTWIAGRQGNEPWKQWHMVDLIRSASRGKPFWHAEAQGGPLWMQPQVLDRPLEDGRIAEPEDVRLWNMVSFAGGATGLLYPRWRPLLDGPLFGAFGLYGMDGSRTPRSDMASRIAKWATAPEQGDLWDSKPATGDVGIIVVPESQLFCHAQTGSSDFYAQAARGAYRGFFDNNIQADWVHIDDIEEYDLLYLPYPAMLKRDTVDRIRRWVKRGGKLVSEGCPAYFGDRGHAGTVQPNLGLDEVFGAREAYIEFTPDILDGLTFTVGELKVPGGVFRQAYEASGGRIAGLYQDGSVAAVDHEYGKGQTRLLRTFPGYGHFNRPGKDSTRFFSDLLTWAGKRQHVSLSERGVVARLHVGAGSTYVWITNHNRVSTRVEVEVAPIWRPLEEVDVLWGNPPACTESDRISVQLDGRDAFIARIGSKRE